MKSQSKNSHVNGSLPAGNFCQILQITQTKRTKSGQSYHILTWACLYMTRKRTNEKTAQIKFENSAQTTLRFSPVSFHAPSFNLKNMKNSSNSFKGAPCD